MRGVRRYLVVGISGLVLVVIIPVVLFFVPHFAQFSGGIVYRQSVNRAINNGLKYVNRLPPRQKGVVSRVINVIVGGKYQFSGDTKWLWVPHGLDIIDKNSGSGGYIYALYGDVDNIIGRKEVVIRQDNGERIWVSLTEVVGELGSPPFLPVFLPLRGWGTLYSNKDWIVSRPKTGVVFDPIDLSSVLCEGDFVRVEWLDERPPQFWATLTGGLNYEVLGEIKENKDTSIYRIFLNASCADEFSERQNT